MYIFQPHPNPIEQDMCWAILLSFIIGLVGVALLVALAVFFYFHLPAPLHLLLGVILCISKLFWIFTVQDFVIFSILKFDTKMKINLDKLSE